MQGHGLVDRKLLPYTLTPVSALTALTHPEQHNEAVHPLGMRSDLLTSLSQSILGMRMTIWTEQGQQGSPCSMERDTRRLVTTAKTKNTCTETLPWEFNRHTISDAARTQSPPGRSVQQSGSGDRD